MSQRSSERYEFLSRVLREAVHELPAGLVSGANGATAVECTELLETLLEFERLSAELERGQSEFIEDCRWHFEHYPHFLGRQRHFDSYEEYVRGRKGPLHVRDPEVQFGDRRREL